MKKIYKSRHTYALGVCLTYKSHQNYYLLNKQLLKKFFRNQCNSEELEQVYDWFKTKEGAEYLEMKLEQDMHHYAEEENLLLFPDVPTDRMLQNIRKKRSKSINKQDDFKWIIRAAVVLLFFTILGGSYLILQHSNPVSEQTAKQVYKTISTQEDQHRLMTLSDGTQIRLNSNSSIVLPEVFSDNVREVRLKGEAWFQVAEDSSKPFIIQADKAQVRVLGTEFNVKVDTLARNVQVAVTEGKVSLNNVNRSENRAILTKDTFALYNLQNDEILIEQAPVINYLSWINGRLTFYNDPLWQVNRFLERKYNVRIRYDQQHIGKLALSLDVAAKDLESILDIIANTLNLQFSYNPDRNDVLWTKPNNPINS
ncbi:hypothetical protein CWD77_07950 [Rhodohalobacter barkolensis]|uniref:FecR protein domain-containing protein n=1 Tax=Rhodohalobacter barkolensis TaxID=2053187 RepID=A0A2N0VH48_9BACT|nr:hypothetical protein CWD77_07950 [Rhodohalobacter barkolensis]